MTTESEVASIDNNSGELELLSDYEPNVIALSQFVAETRDGLLAAVQRENPPIDDGFPDPVRDAIMDQLSRAPFPAQRAVVHSVSKLLLDAGEKAAVLNAEMGTGKTQMAICTACIFHEAGYRRCLVLSPPHLVWKWRREILETVPDARVWVLNGPDTLMKLLKLRTLLDEESTPAAPEFFVLGRVRMRMGFHWKPSVAIRKRHVREPTERGNPNSPSVVRTLELAACHRCGEVVTDPDGEPYVSGSVPNDKRLVCSACNERLWTLTHPRRKGAADRRDRLTTALCELPTIGPKTAGRLIDRFGEDLVASLLEDNVYGLLNLMDDEGELVFSDRQAQRMERALGRLTVSFGQGGYQPTEFIKRYLPGAFDLLVVDEGHEYKNATTAQGQAMGVLANVIPKVMVLTGSLMGGYADDLFYLLWRILPQRMLEDGYQPNRRGSFGGAAMAFMREHGVLREIHREVDEGSHRTARGKRVSVRTSKAPGFGPKGIARYVLPYSAFLRLADIGADVLPPYEEQLHEIPMDGLQSERYQKLATSLQQALKEALARRDTSLLGVVLNCLLAWPDCAFREEVVKHPRTRELICFVPPVFDELEVAPKEAALIGLCREEIASGRRVLVYTTYTGRRDTAARLKRLLSDAGLKTAVLRSSVDTSRREDWILEQVDRGVEVLIANPELVKTGLDLLEFPSTLR